MSGFVLKLARQSSGLTQEKLAECLRVDVTSVQGWESGRRPLTAMNVGDFARLSSRLARLGAPSSTGRHLREAVEADLVLSTGIAAGGTWVDPAAHPLATKVHRRNLTNLITWPLTGHLPYQLEEFVPTTPRRGPVPSHPSLYADERTRFFDHMLAVAERGTHADEALLRRQAVYLLGFDHRAEVVEWLRSEWQRAGTRRVDDDISRLLEARSASVALASAGDGTHIHDFVIATSDTKAEIADLNYWAHWIGELAEDEVDDTFMFNRDPRAWSGVRLCRHLTNRLDPTSPHLPLNLHSLYTLVASRPALLTGRSNALASIAEALDRVSSSDALTRTGRDHVAGLRYALRIADY